MKTKNIVAKLLLLCLLPLCFYNSCKKPDANINWSVNTDVYTSPVLVRFVNANNNSTNQPSNFAVQISGKDANKVVMAGVRQPSSPSE